MPWFQVERSGSPAPAGDSGPAGRPTRRRSGPALFLAGLLLTLAVGGVVVGVLWWLQRGLPTDPSGAGRAPETPVALIDGTPITARDVEVELLIQKRLHEQRGQVLTENPDDLNAFRRDILDQLVDQTLIAQAAARAGIEVSDAELQAQLSTLAQGFDMAQLRAAAEGDGIEPAELDEWGRRQLVVTQYMQTDAALTKVKAHLEATGRGLTFGVSPADLATALQAESDVRFIFDGFEGGTGEGVAMVREGHPAPAITLATPGGGAISLSDYQGRPVLVNFWATWCVPCRTEMPLFVSTYNARKGAGLEILGVNVQEAPALVTPFVQQFGLPFPVLLDLDGEIATLYRVKGLPTTIFVGSDGVVRRAHRGAILNAAQLDGFVDEIMP